MTSDLVIGSCVKLRRNEQSADESLVVFQHVKTVSGGIAIFDRNVAAERARIDEFANQFNRRAVIPVQLVAPVTSFLLE